MRFPLLKRSVKDLPSLLDLIFVVDKDLYYRKTFAYGSKLGHLYIPEDQLLNKHVTEVLPAKQARLIMLAIQAASKRKQIHQSEVFASH